MHVRERACTRPAVCTWWWPDRLGHPVTLAKEVPDPTYVVRTYRVPLATYRILFHPYRVRVG
jgi:hypothetical protein